MKARWEQAKVLMKAYPWHCVALAGFLLVLWMNRYHYSSLHGMPIRENRFTGTTQVFTGVWETYR